MAGAALALLEHGLEPESDLAERETLCLAAIAAWRATQGIYRVHPTLLEELLGTPVSGDLPAEVLMRLPEWCVYVETPGHVFAGELRLAGFYAHTEYDVMAKRTELRVLLDVDDGDGNGDLVGHAVHLGGTIEGGIRGAIAASEAHRRKMGFTVMQLRRLREEGERVLAPALGSLVSVLLYLCADDAEIEDRKSMPEKVVRGKKRPIMPSAKAPTIHAAGYRIGAALDLARASASHAAGDGLRSVTPHVRRAHWHRFWRGPKDGERRVYARWLSPMLVGSDEAQSATLRTIKDEK